MLKKNHLIYTLGHITLKKFFLNLAPQDNLVSNWPEETTEGEKIDL